jgi:hypothetical protein
VLELDFPSWREDDEAHVALAFVDTAALEPSRVGHASDRAIVRDCPSKNIKGC